ncbi:MAG TPA: hypothetical protein VNB06_15315 [Thermoanaerobaculia bacterium]|nr:hypothetical protein [Thermoanaerobaculia bacterium]
MLVAVEEEPEAFLGEDRRHRVDSYDEGSYSNREALDPGCRQRVLRATS